MVIVAVMVVVAVTSMPDVMVVTVTIAVRAVLFLDCLDSYGTCGNFRNSEALMTVLTAMALAAVVSVTVRMSVAAVTACTNELFCLVRL